MGVIQIVDTWGLIGGVDLTQESQSNVGSVGFFWVASYTGGDISLIASLMGDSYSGESRENKNVHRYLYPSGGGGIVSSALVMDTNERL